MFSRQLALGWLEGTKRIREDTTLTMEERRHFISLRRKLIRSLHAGESASRWLRCAPVLERRASLPASSPVMWQQLTPYQALVTGTRNIARFIGNEAEAGTIVGKRRSHHAGC
jgi:hypothetical protein